MRLAGPSIVHDNLIGYWDASNPLSTPGSGVWNDLSGNGNNLNNTGNVVTAEFDGILGQNLASQGQYFTNGAISGTMPSLNATMEAWYWPAATEINLGNSKGCIMLLSGGSGCYLSWTKTTNKFSNYWYNHTPNGYHDLHPAVSRSSWHHVLSSWNNADGKLYQWVDGVKASVSTIGTASSGSNLRVGYEGSTRQLAGGLGLIRIYNIPFTDQMAEAQFNAQRSRFGL
jgi:hypothetical protein